MKHINILNIITLLYTNSSRSYVQLLHFDLSISVIYSQYFAKKYIGLIRLFVDKGNEYLWLLSL